MNRNHDIHIYIYLSLTALFGGLGTTVGGWIAI